jgi:hypothetical protein
MYHKMPPRDLECTPCRHPCGAEASQEVYDNQRKPKSGPRAVLAILPRCFSYSASENHEETPPQVMTEAAVLSPEERIPGVDL